MIQLEILIGNICDFMFQIFFFLLIKPNFLIKISEMNVISINQSF